MAIPIKTQKEIELMRISGHILADVLNEICQQARVGISTFELDQIAENLIREKGAIPSFKGYKGFPCTLCTAVDEIIVHGIPSKNQILKEGDLFTVDCGVNYQGFNTDAARTIGIGKISAEKEKLIKVANEALDSATSLVKPGVRVGEISRTIQNIVEKNGFHIIYDLTGHGIGRKLHEEPIIPNYFDGNLGPILEPGMTIAIEPIFSLGTNKMITLRDNWTLVTADKSPSIQLENTILVTENGAEILTNH